MVACQLPNWWQFTLTYLACSRIGAVINPLMHIFRERELSFMLKHGEAKVLIVPKTFRGFDFEQMVAGLRAGLPELEHVGGGRRQRRQQLRGPAERPGTGRTSPTRRPSSRAAGPARTT